MSQDKCGKCLMVTNRATGQSVKTRVVDLCGHRTGVDMDPLAFNAIDGNGRRARRPHVRQAVVVLSWRSAELAAAPRASPGLPAHSPAGLWPKFGPLRQPSTWPPPKLTCLN